MDYNETLKYINNTPKFSKILGNNDLLKLLDTFKNPQNSLKFVHIAGTNGKGSVCAMTAKILSSSGLLVGLYTSPFIECFNERIQINGTPISDDELAEIATEVKTKIDDLGIEISVFAQITAMAFLYFYRNKCDIVVLETGMGGRLDATNVIKTPLCTAITKIGLDHTDYLGDTISKIAEEKCGIIKNDVPVVTAKNQLPEALFVIESHAKIHNSPLYIEGKSDYPLSLSGDFQTLNAGIAVRIAKILGIADVHIKEGLASTKWPARFEFLKPNLILDGAHNPDGVRSLIDSLRKLKKSVIFVVAMMEDKDLKKSADLLDGFAKRIIATEVDIPRCQSASKLSQLFTSCEVISKPVAAIEKALTEAEDDEIVCVCGSLYLAGAVRKHFCED